MSSQPLLPSPRPPQGPPFPPARGLFPIREPYPASKDVSTCWHLSCLWP